MKFAFPSENIADSRYEFILSSQMHTIFVLTLAAFAVPFIFHSAQFPNQLIVGTFVNFLLACSALYLTLRQSIPVILVPSIAAALSGAVFGGFSIYLAYLVPFIWISNAVYVFTIKNFVFGKKNFALAILCGAFFKSTFLFISTLTLVFLGAVPEIFLAPMGLVQFGTALAGGLLAVPTIRLAKK